MAGVRGVAEKTRAVRRSGERGFRRLPVFVQRALVALLGTLCGVLLFDRVLMPQLVRHNDTVRVPALSGRDIASAEQALRSQGLVPVRAPGRYFPGTQKGLVLDVAPPAGMSVKRGRQIAIIPSLGPTEKRMPVLVGATVRMAKVSLSEIGLEVRRIDQMATDLAEPDQILSTTPEPGAPVSEDTQVVLTVSRAPDPVPYYLPDLRGRSGAESAAWLHANGFIASTEIADLSTLSSTSGANGANGANGGGGDVLDALGRPGAVLSQVPAPGSPIWPGQQVRLSVAPGNAPARKWG